MDDPVAIGRPGSYNSTHVDHFRFTRVATRFPDPFEVNMEPAGLQSIRVTFVRVCILLCVSFQANRPGSMEVLPREKYPADLEAKLIHYWEVYQKAQSVLVQRTGMQGESLTRTEWEKILDPGPRNRLTGDEIKQLRKLQARRIEMAGTMARMNSVIDLHEIRKTGRLVRFCREFPKGGMLHNHPNGSLDRETVHLLLNRFNPVIKPAKIIRALSSPPQKMYPGELDFLQSYHGKVAFLDLNEDDRRKFENLFFLPSGNHDFDRFDSIFYLVRLLRKGSKPHFESILYDRFLSRAADHNLSLVEFTRAVKGPEILRQMDDIAVKALEDHGIVMRINASFNRSRDSELNLARLEKLQSLGSSTVLAGIDLLGDEKDFPAFEAGYRIYGRMLAIEATGTHGKLHRTIHAAGLGEPRNIRDAMLIGAERIGHGCGLMDDPVVLEYASRRELPVEVNLVSNVRLKYVKDFESHPFLKLLRMGLKVSLSTDDEGILETDISNEYQMAITHSNMTWHEMKRLALNSVETAFVDSEVREKLLKKLEDELRSFEERWKTGRQ